MKNLNLKMALMAMASMLFVSASACNNEAKQAEQEVAVEEEMESPDFEEESESTIALLPEYIAVKNALFNDDQVAVQQNAKDLLQQYYALNEEGMTELQSSKLEEAIEALAAAEEISAQRKLFAVVSNEMYELVQQTGLGGETLHWAHCPMALNNQGANWLSLEKQIQNPYMGQRMPRCGAVQETLAE